jgi:hemolysin activation/secretion protein
MADPTFQDAQLQHLIEDVTEIKALIRSNYVTTEAFIPVRNLVYGLVGLIMASFVGALVALVGSR